MSELLETKIAVFGMGIIGSRCADNLTKAGMDVRTWNRTPKERIDAKANPNKAAEGADVVAFYLKDGEACREVFEQIRESLRRARILINHSTIDLKTTHWLADECAALGCAFLDCPFTGSKIAAENGELVYYAGGAEELIEKYREVLEVTAREIIPVGKVGNATVIKVATNLISASTVQALSESLAIASAHGITAESFISAVGGNACGSALAAMKLPTMVAGEYETHFSLDNMLKDAKFAMHLAENAQLKTPGIEATAGVMQELCENGSSGLDYSALYRQFEN
jgi:3-hydroxyisobutyrate dehydrogenase-like beta-hydroxyacid dehydrogenase